MSVSITDELTPHLNLHEIGRFVDALKAEVSKVLVGQADMVDLLLAAMLSNGHVLIEGVPGTAKTLTAKLLAKAVEAKFSRIQFTPDLMPSDVTGTMVFNPQSRVFEFAPGPIFANIVLIDEVNRAPAKTQSALFEVMEEKQTTVAGRTHPMPSPFLVVATQNPVEHEGTYRLPEAQLDRFMFKITIDYPSPAEELEILNRSRIDHDPTRIVQPVVPVAHLVQLRQTIASVTVDNAIKQYIVEISRCTRSNSSIYLGVSPRASQQLMAASQALAVLSGRDFVTPDDVRRAIYPAFRHRVVLSPDKEMEGASPDDVIRDIVGRVEVPR
jgi:MoxR-like ATPase